jgi:hypothetical protein
MIDIYYIVTNSLKELEENYFLKTLKEKCPNFTPKGILYKPKKENIGNFRDEDYLDTLIFRSETVIDLVKNNTNKIIIISDVDIIFLKDFYDFVIENIKDKDILHMRDGYFERNVINGGFTVIKCNDKTKSFYETILNKTKNSKNKFYLDQDAILDYYYKDKNPLQISWDYLPADMFPVRYDFQKMKNHKNNLVLFHATLTMPKQNKTSLEQKKEYLSNFKLWFENKIDKAY